MLIDTGCGICDLKGIVKALTDKTLIVVLTHAHMDYAGGMCAFDQNFNGHVGYMGMPNCFSQPESAADDLIHICEEVLAGKGEPTSYEFLGVPLVQMGYGAVKMSWDPKNLKE